MLSLALPTIYVRHLHAIVLPAFAAFNGIPKLVIAPLFVTWFGLGAEPKVLLAFLLGLFPVFVSAVTGLSEIEPDLLDLAKLAGGNEWRLFRMVRLPNALPHLLDALKVAFPLLLAGSIVGEFIGGNHGIGYLILSGQSNRLLPDERGDRRFVGRVRRAVLQALREEPERRYASAGQMGEEIGRFLEGRPVLAQPDRLGYRVPKLVGRNRVAVVASGVFVSSLAGRARRNRRGPCHKIPRDELIGNEL